MASLNTKAPLVVIVGETASGKSALAFELAQRFDGEIICADSRTVYKGLDIGTAKPTPEDQSRIPHHCLDIVEPDQTFTAADFKAQAMAAIQGMTGRGKLPIMVGGTGLYVDSVVYDYQFRPPADPEQRMELQGLTVPELQQRLSVQGITLPENEMNPRHLIRAIETKGRQPDRRPLRQNTLILGLRPEAEELRQRIARRVDSMMRGGLMDEARELSETHGWDAAPMQTIGYQEWKKYLDGSQDLGQTTDLIVRHTLAYAKRQRTWFKRNNSVHWLSNGEELAQSVELTTTLLNK